MRPILILLSILFSCSLLAKNDWCKFDTDFAEAYLQARNNYASTVRFRRANKEKYSNVRTGKMRVKIYGHDYQKVSLKQEVKSLFGDVEVKYQVERNGKILIFPKNIVGDKAIIFDPSGDYFRVMKIKKSKDGHVGHTQTYYDLHGKEVSQPPKFPQEEWLSKKEQLTHFTAIP